VARRAGFRDAPLPDYDPWRGWSNFEFINDEGRVNEVDLLVLTPAGLVLVEIKSRPGTARPRTTVPAWTVGSGRRAQCCGERGE
jgi:hypothetical protein